MQFGMAVVAMIKIAAALCVPGYSSVFTSLDLLVHSPALRGEWMLPPVYIQENGLSGAAQFAQGPPGGSGKRQDSNPMLSDPEACV